MPDPQGIIRLELQDSWQAREFANLLESIDTSYRLIWIVVEDEYRGFTLARFYDDFFLLDRIGSMRLLLSDLPPWVIADFITDWRAENTRRSAVEAAKDLGEKIIAADLLKSVLNTKRAKHPDNAELDEPSRALLKIVEKLLTDVAKDRRVRRFSSASR